MKKTTLDEARAQGLKLGFTLLEKESLGATVPMLWRCGACGHEWKARLSNLAYGRGCPACSGHAKLTKEILAKRAADAGFELASADELESARRVTLRCSHGHEWSIAILRVGSSGCPECATPGRAPLGLARIQKLAKKRGGACLSTEYVNARSPLLMRCAHGHEWSTTANSLIHSETWCPVCAAENRSKKK